MYILYSDFSSCFSRVWYFRIFTNTLWTNQVLLAIEENLFNLVRDSVNPIEIISHNQAVCFGVYIALCVRFLKIEVFWRTYVLLGTTYCGLTPCNAFALDSSRLLKSDKAKSVHDCTPRNWDMLLMYVRSYIFSWLRLSRSGILHM